MGTRAGHETHVSTPETAASPSPVDAIVVGAGPAGLTAALCLARWRRTVVLLDGGPGRWAHGQRNHNYLGFPGGVTAVELHDRGRRQLDEYPEVTVLPSRATGVGRSADGTVSVTLPDGAAVRGAGLVLATGVRDQFPAFEGSEACVGRSLFWCIACDGYESQGTSAVVVGRGREAALEALQLTRFAPEVTLLVDPADRSSTDAELAVQLDRYGVRRVTGRLARAVGPDGPPTDGRITAVELADGTRLAADRVFAVGGARPETALASALGVRLADNGWIECDTEQRTSVPGVYAAGDVTKPHGHQVATAAHEGTQAAAAVNFDLYERYDPALVC
ncbi:MAG: thioredoxin reductase [Mycobacterium sp.]|nr:thioredoxin reductase [Mycobacterium sp.]